MPFSMTAFFIRETPASFLGVGGFSKNTITNLNVKKRKHDKHRYS